MRRTPEQLAEIEVAMHHLRDALLANGPAHQEDMLLREAIMIATSNPAFVMTFDHMHEEVDGSCARAWTSPPLAPAEAIGAMLAEHEMIVDAIRTQDPEGADPAMRWHLSQGRKRLMP